MAGLFLTALGVPLVVFGLRMALLRPRPMNLLGMLLAPVGMALVWLGFARWSWPGFFGG